ncbi:hypothetical protein Rhe02_50520 [Rhizocola hellebori]|uniref:Uncharacterized protein n=1 Tax=Rhizocola hellebori TaxID=1392758 RepID=A0A8J3VHY1_9ACTN|nr:hypothetical protein [Rhizocola hellebori]GIH06985.1 hypothetical protein Rhe02_50520 [Rhizocola hellebori]
MRVLRVVLGILTLLLATPVLVAGAVGWWTMQHRSPDGAFKADLAPLSAENRVVVVPDVDAVLRRDAPFARADQTELRLTADSGSFVGMATPADLAAYLTGVNYTEISGVSLGRGPLAIQTRAIAAPSQQPTAPSDQPTANTGDQPTAPSDQPTANTGDQPAASGDQPAATGGQLAPPSAQQFWLRAATGELRWTPTTDRDRHLALIVVAPPGDAPIRLSVALTAGWLNSTTWGLLILGPVLLLLGLAALAWPQRPREIVYVVDAPTASAGFTLPAPRSLPHLFRRPALPASDLPITPIPAPTSAAGIPVAGGAPAPSAYTATPISPDAPPSLPTQFTFQPSPPFQPELTWPPAEPPTTTESAREIPTQELPTIDAENPMPTEGMQLHFAKPQ